MSEHKINFPLCSLYKTFTEELEELEELEDEEDSDNMDRNNVESDNVNSESEFFDPCAGLNESNISFLNKIFEDNNEISSSDSDYEGESELDFGGEDENEEIQPSYNDGNEFDEIIIALEQKELT